nr:Chain I, Myelin basic protein (MBP)-peptide [synthetic construct]1U3H_P Chain P, Myelin basic protein (MBP)-peptide [synthetic construct]
SRGGASQYRPSQ